MTQETLPLVLPLNRPQYVPTSETLISALAWEVLRCDGGQAPDSGRRFQLIDDKQDSVASSGQTRPAGPALIDFAQTLGEVGIQRDEKLDADTVASAVLNSIAGVRPTRARSQAASPMTPALALLQDSVGMTGMGNPVNYASILETMFLLGAPTSAAEDTMARLWLKAATGRLEIDPLLRRIDQAFSATYGGYYQIEQRPTGNEALRGLLPNSPFGWLHDSWLKLTSDAWVEALPPRVWIDWASTVLRMGLAFGFLWEAEHHRSLYRSLANGHDLTQVVSPESSPELLPWPPSYLPPSSRSVRPAMRRRIDEGGHLRILMAEELKRGSDPSVWSRSNDFFESATKALQDSSRPGTLKNAYETVFYSLVQRDEADHYALLRSRGTNVTLIEPGTEWVAMVAGLTASGPGQPTRVGLIIEELHRLGLRPPVPELVHLLEAAGLARGSADADHGVRVANPYGEGQRA